LTWLSITDEKDAEENNENERLYLLSKDAGHEAQYYLKDPRSQISDQDSWLVFSEFEIWDLRSEI